jgi:hypothetical protein
LAHEAAVCCGATSGRVLEILRTLGAPRPGPPPIIHSGPAAPLRERMRLTRFSRPTRRTVSLQSVGNLWAPTASDIEGPTDLDWVGLCFTPSPLATCSRAQRSPTLLLHRTTPPRRSGKCLRAHSGASGVPFSVLILEKHPRPRLSKTRQGPARVV